MKYRCKDRKRIYQKLEREATSEENNEVMKVTAYPKESKMAIVRSIYRNKEELDLA
jgi:hypothetical protein